MTGMVDLCACEGEVQAAAPANSARTSRRPIRPNFLPHVTALSSALVMLHQSALVLWSVERDSKDRHGFVIALDLTVPKSYHRAPAPDAFGDFGVH